MTDFALHVEPREADAIVVRLVGELTVDHTEELERHLRGAAAEAPSRVVLDASELTFICSSALGALLEFRKALRDRDATLRLSGAPPQIAEVFRRTRLAELFPMFASADAALETQ